MRIKKLTVTRVTVTKRTHAKGKEREMKVSRADVAREAGVTPTTVSCVLNNTRPVSKKVRKQVMDAVEKLNYVWDFSSRAMRGKKTMQIVVIVNDLLNPFFASMVKKMEEKFGGQGYSLSISSETDIDKNVSVLLARKVDGVYFCSDIAEKDWEKLNTLVENGIKVLTSPKIEYAKRQTTIDMDTESAVKGGVEYLYQSGHKNIAFLTSVAEGQVLDGREQVYIEQVKLKGLTPKVIRIGKSAKLPTIELGRKLFNKIIEEKIDVSAIFGLNDLITIGAMMQAKDMGYAVPNDYSFLGIDGIYLSDIVSPKLTTFSCDMDVFSEKVFELLINAISNEEFGNYIQPLKLTVGGSVKNIKG